MANVIRVQQGGIQAVRGIMREVRSDSLNGRRSRPSGVTITIQRPDGTNLIVSAALNFVQDGTFVYYWDTTGLAHGDYKAMVHFGYAFASASSGATKVGERAVILRLVPVA